MLTFSSCSGVIGYGVLLWNVGEKEIPDGTVVPVYLKSNISKVYVIGLPETKEKIEVPLWKLSAPESKSKALKRAQKYSEYKGKYAFCILDGLPIRFTVCAKMKLFARFIKKKAFLLQTAEFLFLVNGFMFLLTTELKAGALATILGSLK